MHRRLQGFCGSAKEWYQTNVLATGAPVDPERIEFARSNDFLDNQHNHYQTYDAGYENDSGDGDLNNTNSNYVGEYEEFSEGVATHHKISEWQAGWNVTNAIQVMVTSSTFFQKFC